MTIYLIVERIEYDVPRHRRRKRAFADYSDDMGYLEERDMDEAVKGLFDSGDPKGFPWFNIYAHGSPAERVKAFFDGFDGHQCFCACNH